VISQPVDPRDIEWEVVRPVYRVYFWQRQPAPPGIPDEHMGYQCEEHRLSGASDVHQVLEWAAATARPEQTFTLYVEHTHDGRAGLIQLAGTDPTVTD
jgi:hypothetical protein